MNLGKFFALFKSPEADEDVRRLEEERAKLEADLRGKRDKVMEELDGLQACSKQAKNSANHTTKELKALSSTPPAGDRIPTIVTIREKLPSEPETI